MPEDDRAEGAEPAAQSAGEPEGDGSVVAREAPASQTPASAPASVAVSPAGSVFRASYVFLGVVTLVNLVADQWSKHWAKTYFESQRPGEGRRIEVVEGLLNFIYAKNRGGAWGLLQNEAEALRRPFFLLVSVAAIVFIVSLYRKLTPGQRALKWGLPLVLGGALGNLIDRIRFGYVIDFIDVYMDIDSGSFWVSIFGSAGVKHWPTFNVADISICVGVGLMAIDMFSPRREKKEKLDKAAPPSVPAEPAVEGPPADKSPTDRDRDSQTAVQGS
jgi:signal peptidase II